MPDPKENAIAELVRLDELVRHHDEHIKHHEARKAEVLRLKSETQTFLRLYDQFSKDGGSSPSTSTKSAPPLSLIDRVSRIAEDLILERQKRTSTDDIFNAVTQAGIAITGSNDSAKKTYISGMLGRSGRFNAIRRKGWWIKELGECPDDPPGTTLEAEADPDEVIGAETAEIGSEYGGDELDTEAPEPGDAIETPSSGGQTPPAEDRSSKPESQGHGGSMARPRVQSSHAAIGVATHGYKTAEATSRTPIATGFSKR